MAKKKKRQRGFHKDSSTRITVSAAILEGEVITTGLPGEVITISWTTRKVPVVCFFKFLPWIFLFMPKLYTDFHYFLHKIIRWEKWHNTKRANMKTHFSVPSFWVSLEAWQGIMFSRLYVYSLPSSFQGSVVGDPFRSLWIQRTIKGSKAVFFLLVVSPSYRSKLQFFQVTTKCQAGNSQSPVLMIFFFRLAASIFSEKEVHSELSDPLLFYSWEENDNLVLFSGN